MIDKNIHLTKEDKSARKKLAIDEEELENLGVDNNRITNENNELNKENIKLNEKLNTIENFFEHNPRARRELNKFLKHEKKQEQSEKKNKEELTNGMSL